MNNFIKKNIWYVAYLILAVGIIVINFTAYRPYYDKEQEYREEIKTLQSEIAELKKLALNESQLKSENGLLQGKISAIVSEYSAGATTEKTTMFINELEKKAGVIIPSINFNQDTIFFNSTFKYKKTGLPLIGYRSSVSFSYRATYESFKALMSYFNDYDEKVNVESLTIAYDTSTGNLSGAMTVNLYSMYGTGKTYEEPSIGNIETGKDNIFDSAELPFK